MQQTDGWMVGHWAAEEAHSSTTHVSALVSKHAIIEALAPQFGPHDQNKATEDSQASLQNTSLSSMTHECLPCFFWALPLAGIYVKCGYHMSSSLSNLMKTL